MNVILMERINKLGDLGEEVTVKPGFARNFLIPRGKAVRATPENRAVFEARRADLEQVQEARLGEARGRAGSLEGMSVTIVVRAGEEGKLYGSVGTHDIAEAVIAKGVEIERAEVRLPEGPIRSTGEYEVDVQLHSDVVVQIQVVVVAE